MIPDPDAAPKAAPPPPSTLKLALIEWTGLLVAGLMVLGLGAFAAADWRTMFRDFVSLDDLPLLTRIVLVPGSIPLLTVPAVASLAMALRARNRPTLRRRWISAAVILGFLGLAVCFVGTRLPIFMVVGKLYAE